MCSSDLIDGSASAPLPPPSPNFMKAMGRTNDAILFGGQVQLYVHSDDDAARALAEQMPSSASRDFGKPFAEKHHALTICNIQHQFMPGVNTPMFGYNGIFPGQTMRARLGEPMVVRVRNACADLETSLHLHGGHTPSHSDGHPCFYTFPGKVRDYFYPHIAPKHHEGGTMDTNDAPSTMWYHDHGNDVTAYNVVHGLVGY